MVTSRQLVEDHVLQRRTVTLELAMHASHDRPTSDHNLSCIRI